LIAEGTTGEQRSEALAETKRLHQRQGELEAEILQLERDKVLHQQALNEYQSRLTYRL
jgi:cell division protein FtsB